MKYTNLLPLLLLCSLFAIISCGDSKADTRKQQARESLGNPVPPATPNTATPNTPEPAQNAAGVWHYVCNNGCEGGAGAKGTCPKCGGDLAHNQAYHDNTNNTSTPNPTTSIGNPPTSPPITPPKTPEPAQNAAGVWHYVCNNGCAGGAGAKGPCAKCGGDLAHNQAYHQ